MRSTSAAAFSLRAPSRPAVDAPARFEGVSADAAPRDGACQSPLRDAQTGLELRFVRSGAGFGDYAVPDGTYGAGERELLRIDCRTLQPVGFVRR